VRKVFFKLSAVWKYIVAELQLLQKIIEFLEIGLTIIKISAKVRQKNKLN